MSDCKTGSGCPVMKSAMCIITVLILSGAIAFAGWSVAEGLKSFRTADRSVSMKGLSERNVEADLGVWMLGYSATGNDLAEVQNQMEAYDKTLKAYLTRTGFTADEISYQPLQSQDLMAQAYRPENIQQGRYIISQTVSLRTTDLSKLDRATAEIGALLKDGLTLSNTGAPVYMFTKLNDIKPEMLAEAVASARKSAEEFSKNSGQRIGAIKGANQGIFEILPRDPNDMVSEQNQRFKRVRVVSTIDFYLE